MLTRRSWFLVIGLMVCLLFGAGVYFLFLDNEADFVTPKSPTVTVKTPVPSSLPEAKLPSSTADATPATQLPANSNQAPYLYNAQGQLQSITYPDGSTYTYRYDAYGDKIGEITRTGRTWTYTYDQNHHPLTIIDPDGRVTQPEASPSQHESP